MTEKLTRERLKRRCDCSCGAEPICEYTMGAGFSFVCVVCGKRTHSWRRLADADAEWAKVVADG